METNTAHLPARSKKKGFPVRCIETGQVYASRTICARRLGVDPTTIGKVLRQRTAIDGQHFESLPPGQPLPADAITTPGSFVARRRTRRVSPAARPEQSDCPALTGMHYQAGIARFDLGVLSTHDLIAVLIGCMQLFRDVAGADAFTGRSKNDWAFAEHRLRCVVEELQRREAGV